MNYTLLSIGDIPWKTIGAFLVVVLLSGFAFYKENFLLSGSDKSYLKRLEKKSKTKLSGKMIVAISGVFFASLSLLLSYVFYIKK